MLAGAVLREYRQVEYPDGNLTPKGWKPDYTIGRTMLSVDLGIRSPAALLWVEDLALGAWVVTREWTPDQVSISDLCQLLLRTTAPRRLATQGKIPIDKVVIDPAGHARSSQTGHADADVWAMAYPVGYGLRPAWERNPSRRGVVEGITRLAISLETRRVLFASDMIMSGMSADPKARTLARSLTGYRWDSRNPTVPMKDGIHDHQIDALRYGHREVMWDNRPRAAVPSEQQPEAPRSGRARPPAQIDPAMGLDSR